MIGLPGSGKSSIAKKIIEYHHINGIHISEISLDRIRSKPKMIKMIKEAARSNNAIIVDNTNLSSETRDEISHYVLDIEENYYVRFVHLNTSLERCKHNNLYRYYVNWEKDPKLINEMVYRMMVNQYEKPSKTEIVDQIDEVEPETPLDPRYFLLLL
jgi:adenylate kinase family enzyme